MAAHVQPSPRTHRTRWQTTRQPRQQPVRTEQLTGSPGAAFRRPRRRGCWPLRTRLSPARAGQDRDGAFNALNCRRGRGRRYGVVLGARSVLTVSRSGLALRAMTRPAAGWGEVGMAEAEAAGSEGFAERMLHMMNEGALALMVSVGHRTGLFGVMAAMPAATSPQIASGAGLDERYVREWLAAMTTGRIVDHDSVTGTFSLPADHAAWLTRAAGIDNLAIQAQYLGLLALVEDQIVDCFRHGGGVPYSAFPKF